MENKYLFKRGYVSMAAQHNCVFNMALLIRFLKQNATLTIVFGILYNYTT